MGESYPTDPIYLTNACGEMTGHGSISEADCAKVSFEDGPGLVLTYIVKIGNEKYVQGNLEVCFRDPFWGDDGKDFDSENAVRNFCEKACEEIRARLTQGSLLMPINDGMPGRLVISVAIPLVDVSNGEDAKLQLQSAFGKYAFPEGSWRFDNGFVDDALYYWDGQQKYVAAIAAGDEAAAIEIAGLYNLAHQMELSGFTLETFARDYDDALAMNSNGRLGR